MGRVTLQGKVPPLVTRRPTVDPDLCGTEPIEDRAMLIDATTSGVRWAVVTLTNDTAGRESLAPVTRTIDEARCEYFPYVTVVPPGSRVVVTNADAGLHDVHVMPEKGADSNHTLRAETAVELAFDEPDHVLLGCDLHYWTRGWVIVSDAPFTAITGEDGSFDIAGVPAGAWRMTVWHERLGTAVRDVTVGAPGSRVTEDVALAAPVPTRAKRTPAP
jgi:plastocyanin